MTTKQYLDNGTVKTSEIVCNFLISAVGQLSEPRIPPIDGIHLTNELLSEALERREFNVDKGRKPSDFQGAVMHSSQWDHSIDLNGKTVAVVGTGASAIQVNYIVIFEILSIMILRDLRSFLNYKKLLEN